MDQARVVLNEILETLEGLVSLFLPDSGLLSILVELGFLENLVVGEL